MQLSVIIACSRWCEYHQVVTMWWSFRGVHLGDGGPFPLEVFGAWAVEARRPREVLRKRVGDDSGRHRGGMAVGDEGVFAEGAGVGRDPFSRSALCCGVWCGLGRCGRDG